MLILKNNNKFEANIAYFIIFHIFHYKKNGVYRYLYSSWDVWIRRVDEAIVISFEGGVWLLSGDSTLPSSCLHQES